MSNTTEIARFLEEHQRYLEERKRDQEQYTRWLNGGCPGKDPQMVIRMFQSWLAEKPRVMCWQGEESHTYRGIPMRWLRQALRDANTQDR